MAVALSGELEREIHVHGVEAPVIVKISREGISFRVKGSRTELTNGWVQTVEAMNTPTNVKSYLMNKPYETLQHAARQRKETHVHTKTSM